MIDDTAPKCLDGKGRVTQLLVASQWLKVQTSVWVLELCGEIGGAWSLVIEMGAVIFFTITVISYSRKRIFGKKGPVP